MAHNYSLWLGSIVLLFLCFAPCAYCNAPNITDICTKHNNPEFCEQILKAKKGAELPALAEYVIQQIQIRVGSTKTALDMMVQQTKEARLAQHYNYCRKRYDEAMEGIKKTKQQLDNKDYYAMDVAASDVMTDIDDCASSEVPGYDPSVFIVKTNQDLENLCVIVMIIANCLIGKY